MHKFVISSFDYWWILAASGSFSMISYFTGALGSDTSESMRIISAESSSSPPMASSSEPAAELSSLAKAVAAVLIY